MASEDDRFVLTVRFKRPKRCPHPRKDERFEKLFDLDEKKPRVGPKVDPFGRPLAGVAPEDVYSSSDDEIEEAVIESTPVIEQDKEIIEYGDESDRFAVIGCDWDNIKADDLFVLFETVYRSLKSTYSKAVKRTAIYLSDIGHEKLSTENINGPSLEIPEYKREEEEDDETRQDALRKYQRERSRYYYGIVELYSIEQAKLLYEELDGVEVAFALDGLDIRFVPPSINFNREPTSECFEIPKNYKPPVSWVSALRHSKVECKWDITPAGRFKTLTKRFTEKELESLDLSEYLASEDETHDEANIEELRAVLDTLNTDDKTEESEDDYSDDQKSGNDASNVSATVGKFKISFGPDVAIANLNKPREPSLPILDKKKSKKKEAKKAEEPDIEGRHFDMRHMKQKGAKKSSRHIPQQPGFKSDFEDARFTRLFKDPDFSIDTTHPKYRNTEFNERLLREKSMKK